MSENITDATKVVQTEVPADLYDRFVTVAEARELTIKDAASEAIAEFTYRYQPVDPDDPLFAPLNRDVSTIPTDDDASDRVDELAYPGEE